MRTGTVIRILCAVRGFPRPHACIHPCVMDCMSVCITHADLQVMVCTSGSPMNSGSDPVTSPRSSTRGRRRAELAGVSQTMGEGQTTA